MPSSPKRLNRKDRKAREIRKAIAVLFGLCLLAAAAGYFYFSARANMRPIDEATFCPTDAQGPSSITDILIDRTDPFSLTQQAAIRDRLNEIRDHSGRYDMLEIYSVEPTNEKLLKPEFSMCNPGRGDETSQWTGNPHMVEERWQALFADPLQHLFDSILDASTAQISPIMESMQSVIVTRLGSQELAAKKTPRRLIVISDMIQYVQDYSQYKPLEPFNQFKTTPYYQSVQSDMSGIQIEIWYIKRQKTLRVQTQKHLDFWREYIEAQGGTLDKVWQVPGT